MQSGRSSARVRYAHIPGNAGHLCSVLAYWLVVALFMLQSAFALDPTAPVRTPTIDLTTCLFEQRCADIGRCFNHLNRCIDGYCCPIKTPRPTRTPSSCRDARDCVDPTAYACVEGFCVGKTPTPSPTADPDCPFFCLGDCDGDRVVSISNLLECVNVALQGPDAAGSCAACSSRGDRVSVGDLVGAVANALSGCLPRGCPRVRQQGAGRH